MNRTIAIILMCFAILRWNTVTAQNLVSNPGFEFVSTCSVSTLEEGTQAVEEWFTYDIGDNSPDIYNTCFNAPLNPPNTLAGYSMPHQGTSMAGIAYYPTPDHIEVISVKLSDTLQKDSAYCVSFFTKNSYYQDVEYWSSNLGAFFSDDTIDHLVVRANSPHIAPQNAVKGNEWVEINGYYIATGMETYLNIGFFVQHPDYYHPLAYPDDFIYYFLDDVTVQACNKDSLLHVTLELPNVFTPNGDTMNASYKIRYNNIKTMHVQILNRWGNLIIQYDGLVNSWDGLDADGHLVADGVYFVKVTAETKFDETLVKQQFLHVISHPD